MKCEANNCTRKAAYREDYDAALCDVHAELPAYSPPAKRSKPVQVRTWLSLIPLLPHIAWLGGLVVTEGRRQPRLGGLQ